MLDYLNGYLYMDSRDVPANGQSGARQLWNISNPTQPVEYLSSRIPSGGVMHTAVRFLPDYRVNDDGFINVFDPLQMRAESPPAYLTGTAGARGLTVIPYEYSGGTSVRIYDTRLGKTVSKFSDYGFDGTPTPIGNLLIVAGIRGQSRGFAMYDIGDPANPALLDLISPGDSGWQDYVPGYEYAVWKHYLVLPVPLLGGSLGFVDFSDPTYLRHAGFIDGTLGPSRYAQFQDNSMFVGTAKYDMSPLLSGGVPSLAQNFPNHDGEYMLPLGNLIASAENSEQGRVNRFTIFAHQAAPDTTKPAVAFHNPPSGANYQHVKTRVGVVMHETLNYATINATTFRVYPTAGGADVAGTRNAHDKDILTFTPDSDLAPSTNYTVSLSGIKDVSGNTMTPYAFQFRTAGPGDPPPVIITQITASAYPAPVGSSVNFTATASGGQGAREYRWDFGDGSNRTAWSSSTTASHTYAARGHYRVKVQVRDTTGRYPKTSSDRGDRHPTGPGRSRRPKGSQIIVDAANRRVWTVNPDSNTVTVINADTLAKVAEYLVSKDPRSLAQDASGRIWVTSLDADRIDILSRTTGALVDGFQLPPGSRPHDIVFNGDKSYAYVSLQGSGKVVRINSGHHGQCDARRRRPRPRWR
ncbi:MAG: PKD domain-containing protein [Bdellovibrionaceae bacterium]|nr:PKD domain-containing protein [Pseudobdellovibrionaceae bacterium]